jgi:hypothetical protein
MKWYKTQASETGLLLSQGQNLMAVRAVTASAINATNCFAPFLPVVGTVNVCHLLKLERLVGVLLLMITVLSMCHVFELTAACRARVVWRLTCQPV